MPKVKCAECNYRSYTRLDDKAIYSHLSGKDTLCRDVIGIYPMLPDETTNILMPDFDDEDWQKDVSAVRDICNEYNIPCCVERSRSGAGAHLWIFFETPVTAAMARKLGSGLLTEAMKKRHEISFGSYDRMFSNQDTMPSDGFGNLIALSLHKQAVLRVNSVFVDENFIPYPDQWEYLSCIQKVSEEDVICLINALCKKSELGELYSEEIAEKPWELKPDNISEISFPNNLNIIISNMIYIPKNGIAQNGLNRIKRLAGFKNPEFYKAQAMHMSTYGKPRIISLANENEEYINMLIKSDEQIVANGIYFKMVTKNNGSTYSNKIKRLLTFHSIEHSVKNKLNHSFVVIDGKTVWYSSSEIFNTSNEDNYVLMIEDDVLAGELTAQLE